MRSTPLPFLLSFLSLITLSSSLVVAGTVTKASGKKIILEFNNEPMPPLKSKVTILDQDSHKEIGYVEIVKTKDQRALGILKKGAAKPGDTADIAVSNVLDDHREPAKVNSNEYLANQKEKKKRTGSRLSYGVGTEFVNTQMMLKSSKNSGTLDGNGFGVRGAVEYAFTREWILLTSVGLHPLNMTSTSTEVSSISTNYLGTEGIVRYAFDKRTEGIWIGGGAGYYLTMSSNLSPKPASDFVIIASAGYNVRLAHNYFALKGDFVMFPSKSFNGYTYQAYQFVIGGVYFF